MAGYSDTRQLIIDTLMGRPAGTEIQPEDHQAFALQIIDYVRSVELVAGNATPIGFADADTVPVQPDNGQAVYLSQVGGGTTVVFTNFIDQNGNAISVTSDSSSITLVNLLWNGQYWTKQETRIPFSQNAVDLDTEQTITAKKTFSAGINLNGTTISKVGSPVNTDDAANKQYVDDLTSISFTNPVGEWCPDPCFWKGDDGYFYIKGTGRLVTVKRTRDFVNYEDTGRIFISTEAQNELFDLYGHYATDDSTYKLHPNYWAPFVIKIGDNWVLYQAIIERTGTKTDAVDGTAHIVAFTSKTPYGNFSNPVTIVSDNEITAAYNSSTKWNNIIDPFVYCDPFDNHIYLLAGSSYGIRRKRLSDDGLSMYKDGSTLAVDNYAMHAAGQSIETDPSRATVYEGAYLYNKIGKWGNYWYLFVSSGSYDNRDYCVKVGRCPNTNYHIGGTTNINFQDKASRIMRVGGGTTILSTESDTSTFWGPGHIGGIFETEDGKTWMLYHCHDGNGTQDRKLFIQELLWDENGWPYFENNGHPIANGRISRHIITFTNDVEYNKAITEVPNDGKVYGRTHGEWVEAEKAKGDYKQLIDYTVTGNTNQIGFLKTDAGEDITKYRDLIIDCTLIYNENHKARTMGITTGNREIATSNTICDVAYKTCYRIRIKLGNRFTSEVYFENHTNSWSNPQFNDTNVGRNAFRNINEDPKYIKLLLHSQFLAGEKLTIYGR